MATSAFKSTTRRTPVNQSPSSDSSSSARAHRRSRSLSRFSRPLPRDDFPEENAPKAKGKFVNTVRRSGFPELALDDLSVQFFNSADRGRSASRRDDVSSTDEGASSAAQRRGRSVSRPSSRVNQGKSSAGGNLGSLARESDNSRRRRSVSVIRYQISDSESDLDHTQTSSYRGAGVKNGCSQGGVSNKAGGLRRSYSQKDLKYHDAYSSHSSALTDDEGRDAHANQSGVEKTIRAVYAQRKGDHPTGEDVNDGLYVVMRKELRSAVEEIRSELELEAKPETVEKVCEIVKKQLALEAKTVVTGESKFAALGADSLDTSIGKGNGSVSASDDSLLSGRSDVLQAVSTIKRNYATELEKSEKRKQDLLAEILLEEQRGRQISKIVKELLPGQENSDVERAPRTRKRSNDRTRMSKRLTEEAEKYIEDFISNVEDTDISSLDGERSDTSSTLGVVAKTEHFQSPAVSRTELFQTPVVPKSRPVEMDGVVLPWLQWETSNDASPLSCKNKEPTSTPNSNLWDASLERSPVCELSMRSMSSHGSWSPGIADVHSINRSEVTSSNLADPGSYASRLLSFSATRTSRVDVDDYLNRSSDEDLLLERWNQLPKIHSGGLLLCNRMFF